ncbi:MAG TPA: Crp/Fnr family transcriptional regulator [Clostridiales bacterium]|jgi:CRP-like cAMP-binding protein|nr:Crp/Fnr family transcriptional regulator [Clostridiales bacterium]
MTVHYNCAKCKDRLCIHKVPIFSSLDSEDLRKIMGLISHSEYKKGETIVFEQEEPDSVIIINEGSAKAYKNTADGREQILYVFSEGDFFGEQNLFTGQPSTYTVEALQPVKICKLSRKQFQELLYRFPDIAVKIIVELGNRMTRLENALQSIGVRNVDNRIGIILLEFAEKYGTKNEKGTIIHLPISREGMANYLGVARETVSRKLSQLENEGIIQSLNNKEILIPDMDRIEELAGV